MNSPPGMTLLRWLPGLLNARFRECRAFSNDPDYTDAPGRTYMPNSSKMMLRRTESFIAEPRDPAPTAGCAALSVSVLGEVRPALGPAFGVRLRALCGFFCVASVKIDRVGNVRTLNNLKNNLRRNGILLRELERGVYVKYFSRSLPYLLLTLPHSPLTEAIAMMMGHLMLDENWLRLIARLAKALLSKRLPKLRAKQRQKKILFSRWAFITSHFERALYAGPDQDLNSLWWGLAERFKLLTRPEGRKAPDWRAKYHIANAPAMYHGYLLGELNTSQLTHKLEEYGGIGNHLKAGKSLVRNVFSKGAESAWNESLRRATCESLRSKYFVSEFVCTTSACVPSSLAGKSREIPKRRK